MNANIHNLLPRSGFLEQFSCNRKYDLNLKKNLLSSLHAQDIKLSL